MSRSSTAGSARDEVATPGAVRAHTRAVVDARPRPEAGRATTKLFLKRSRMVVRTTFSSGCMVADCGPSGPYTSHGYSSRSYSNSVHFLENSW